MIFGPSLSIREGLPILNYFTTRHNIYNTPHKRLIELIERKVTDQTVLGLIAKFLKQEVMEGMKRRESREGTPQGAVLSPLLANIYLDPFDHVMAEEGYEMIRYADDFVVMCRNEEEAKVALKKIKRWMKEAGLELHLEKTRIVDVNQKGGFDFLGYHFERGWKWPRKKSLKKLRDAIREKTKRCNGKSLEEIIKKINPILRGWFEYYKHSTKRTFPSLDGLGKNAVTQHTSQTKQTKRTWARSRSSKMAK